MRRLDKCVAMFMFFGMAMSCYGLGLQCTASQKKMFDMDAGSSDGCTCVTAYLKNVKITLPQGLKLSAVCDLSGRLEGDSSWHAIDLKTDKIDLDVWDGSGGAYGANDVYGGQYYFSGSLKLRGKLRYEFGGEENYVLFLPDDFSMQSKVFSYQNLKDIIIMPNYYPSLIPKGFGLPKIEYPSNLNDNSGYCVEADADVLISGIKVTDFGSDDDGTYALNFKLLKAGHFSECNNDQS